MDVLDFLQKQTPTPGLNMPDMERFGFSLVFMGDTDVKLLKDFMGKSQ